MQYEVSQITSQMFYKGFNYYIEWKEYKTGIWVSSWGDFVNEFTNEYLFPENNIITLPGGEKISRIEVASELFPDFFPKTQPTLKPNHRYYYTRTRFYYPPEIKKPEERKWFESVIGLPNEGWENWEIKDNMLIKNV